MSSTAVEVGTLGEAAREFEAAAELTDRAVARLDRVLELAVLKQDSSIVAALVGLRGSCEAARAAARVFAEQVVSHAAVCDGVARAWSRRELDALARRDAVDGPSVSVVWGQPEEPAVLRHTSGGDSWHGRGADAPDRRVDGAGAPPSRRHRCAR